MYKLLFLVLATIHLCSSSRVLELSDRFLEIKKEGHWLIMFYAPWCAHCKRLEPVWALVAQSLYNTNIRVGKIDCIKYPLISTQFSINGFPTIMFLKGDEKEFVFHGERTKEEIVHFALRLNGPPVQQITRHESIDTLKASHKIFFVYVGKFEGSLWETYYDVAERFQPFSFFYATAPEIARKHVTLKEIPTVFVYKENSHYIFEVDKGMYNDRMNLNVSLSEWVNAERFGTFVKITRGNIHQYRQTNKNLVLAVVAENKLEEVPEEMAIFRDMIKSVIVNHRDQFHRWFQFGWIGSPELANSIAMTELPLPYLIVVNSTTNHHHIPDDEPKVLNVENVKLFLDSIRNESAPCYGGNSLPIRLYRTYFEARASLAEMWKGNPVLTAVLFGLPLGFLSLICYSICCADILDADEEEEEPLLNEFSHEKKE
ncbi:protein disulfide-isomerase TMX3 [Cimex lectularius]|uniref:Thioredoxin domain-containing protein n=1 Tax=Cimex lectularius TaxID=79782 RepID=A0A8I6S5Y6_CIMLE|nr:protein disulfide-isomerase TMX3 [Cimex lectularius]